MKRKGMGKRIAAIVLAITMSISTAGVQTGIVKAGVAGENTTVETPATETTTAETPAESGDSAADVESADETATDSTMNEGNETNDEGSIGEETTDPVITDEEATGDVVDEENADEETNGDVSEEDEITDGEEIADEELTPEELAAKLAAEEEARLAAEEEARLAVEKEAARIRAELLATSPEIISQYTQGNVTVNVQAPEGAFPGEYHRRASGDGLKPLPDIDASAEGRASVFRRYSGGKDYLDSSECYFELYLGIVYDLGGREVELRRAERHVKLGTGELSSGVAEILCAEFHLVLAVPVA